jgi:endonuclease III
MSAAKRPHAGKSGSGKSPPAKASTGKPAAKPATKPAPKHVAAARPAAPAKPAPVKPEPPAPPAVKQPARSVLMPKLVKALKAQYKPVTPVTSRPVLDQVLFACCLENAPADVAEKALARLVEGAFDLNEIRVTTVSELAEVLHDLPDPSRAALALRRALQSVFESTYAFSLDQAKKHSLAHGLKTLESMHGISPFVVNYVASTSLGAHMIPLDHGALAALYLCGIITQPEYDSGKVTGLEKLIPKKAAAEFNSLLHQFGIECLTNLHGATVKKILQAVNPAAKDRFPKRGEPLPAPNPPAPAATKEGQKAAEAARASAEAHRPAGPQAAARPAGKTPLPPPGSGPKRTADGKTASGKPGPKPFVVKPNMGKPITIKPEAAPPQPPAKPTPPAKPAAAGPKRPAPPAKAVDAKRHSQELTKKKPR